MKDITINITVNAEQLAAVTQVAAGLDPTEYLTANVNSMIQSWVQAEYEHTLRLLGERATTMAWEDRQKLLAQLDNTLPPPPKEEESSEIKPE